MSLALSTGASREAFVEKRALILHSLDGKALFPKHRSTSRFVSWCVACVSWCVADFIYTQTLMSSILNSFYFTTSIECQEKLMKQGSVCTNATEHATSAHDTATELKAMRCYFTFLC